MIVGVGAIPFLFRFYFNLNDNKVRKFLKKQKGTIVDLGCGNGRFLAHADLGDNHQAN
jgi:tRNA G46 methylase TrmB